MPELIYPCVGTILQIEMVVEVFRGTAIRVLEGNNLRVRVVDELVMCVVHKDLPKLIDPRVRRICRIERIKEKPGIVGIVRLECDELRIGVVAEVIKVFVNENLPEPIYARNWCAKFIQRIEKIPPVIPVFRLQANDLRVAIEIKVVAGLILKNVASIGDPDDRS